MDPEKNQYISNTDSDLAKQEEWLRHYTNKSNEAYFIIENKEGGSVGTVRMYDAKADSFCWGSWIIKQSTPFFIALESAMMIYDYAFCTLKFKQSHFDVRKDNKKVIEFHLRTGAKLVDSDEQNLYFVITPKDLLKFKSKYSKYIASSIEVSFV